MFFFSGRTLYSAWLGDSQSVLVSRICLKFTFKIVDRFLACFGSRLLERLLFIGCELVYRLPCKQCCGIRIRKYFFWLRGVVNPNCGSDFSSLNTNIFAAFFYY
jgi:hypothetical protein